MAAICNKCGKKLNFWDEQEDFRIYRTLGYGTRYDGEKLRLDLCCECMEKFIEECVISPVVINDGSRMIRGDISHT